MGWIAGVESARMWQKSDILYLIACSGIAIWIGVSEPVNPYIFWPLMGICWLLFVVSIMWRS